MKIQRTGQVAAPPEQNQRHEGADAWANDTYLSIPEVWGVCGQWQEMRLER